MDKQKYLKQDSIWTVKNSKNIPWIWKNLLKFRDRMKRKVEFSLASGENTFFWLDPWLGGEALWNRIENAGEYILMEAKMTKIIDLWDGDSWKDCPHTDIRSFRIIWEELYRVQWCPIVREDSIHWRSANGSNRNFSINEAWESGRNRGPSVPWPKDIWFSSNIPKHSFVSWRACLDTLPSAEQLQVRNIVISPQRMLCDIGRDSKIHLFFKCEGSKFIWNVCMSRCCPRVRRPDSFDNEVIRVAKTNSRGNDISSVPKLMFNAMVYNIWNERNSRIFSSKKRSKEDIARDIIQGVQEKISTISFHLPKNRLGAFLFSKWCIEVH